MCQASPELELARARIVPGRAALEALFDSLCLAEAQAPLMEGTDAGPPSIAFSTVAIDPALVLPLPTLEQWREATSRDPDLRHILDAAKLSGPALQKASLSNKGYFKAWTNGQLEVENGLIYHYKEPFKAQHRQLQTRVVPPSLRRTVVTACHSSPMAGHSGIKRTHH